MGWVTQDQLEQARQIPVLEYILTYESGKYKRVGKGYRLKLDGAPKLETSKNYLFAKIPT